MLRELEKPLRFLRRYACRTVSEATLNAMMIALRQGLCVVEQNERFLLVTHSLYELRQRY